MPRAHGATKTSWIGSGDFDQPALACVCLHGESARPHRCVQDEAVEPWSDMVTAPIGLAMTPRSARYARLAAVVLVALFLAIAYRFGAFAQVADPKSLVHTLVAMGPRGYLAFVIAYTVLQPFGVPGTVFIIAAPLIWPWQTAFALSMLGTMSASVVGFSFARFVAKDWVSARIPARFRAYGEALERNALQTVILLRLIFWMPQPLHFFLGVSKIKFWTHFWGSLIGYIPPLLLVSYLGGELFDASGNMQPGAWRILAGLLIVTLLTALGIRVYRRQRRRIRVLHEPPP